MGRVRMYADGKKKGKNNKEVWSGKVRRLESNLLEVKLSALRGISTLVAKTRTCKKISQLDHNTFCTFRCLCFHVYFMLILHVYTKFFSKSIGKVDNVGPPSCHYAGSCLPMIIFFLFGKETTTYSVKLF